MARSIDLSKLPSKRYGGKTQIDWDMAAGYKIPFIYDDLSGYLTILAHQKGNYIVIGYLDRTKRMRTNHLFRLQFRDLIDPDKEFLHQPNTKTQEAFLQEVKQRYQGEYEILSAYRGNKKPVWIRHNCAACGHHQFAPTPNNFLRGSGCPACNGSPSFPEICLLLVISQFFPDAKKQKLANRECDIVFYAQEKRIGIQYDGAFYHKDPRKDNDFNRLFLKDETVYLIRVRETGCPELTPHQRLYALEATNRYTRETLQKILSGVFDVIGMLLKQEYRPRLTDKIMQRAKQQSKRAYHYKLLVAEYIHYLDKHGAAPAGRSAKNLQERVAAAIREQRLSDEELASILDAQKRCGIHSEARSPAFIYQDMLNFYAQNEILPRQQAGDEAETLLYREIKRCIYKNRFTEQQMGEYARLRERASNYSMPAERLYSLYTAFIIENQRLPNAGNGPDEKALVSKVNHRLARKSFSREQQAEIEGLRRQYSLKQLKGRIIGEYRCFILDHGRLPLYKAKGVEGKLERGMMRYLRTHQFNCEECREILDMRAQYQTLTRRRKEYSLYLEEKEQE